jgi:hypothetical protein
LAAFVRLQLPRFACHSFVSKYFGENTMPVCDGCGAVVDDAHIRARIERLEMATRYRPIHIQVLLLDAAPPARPEDFFYRAAGDHAERSAGSRAYFDALMACADEKPTRFVREEDALAEFQRRGLFLTNVVECSAEADLDAAVSRCAPSLVKRLQFSYKPKYVAAISSAVRSVLPVLADGGWADRLILDGGRPFDVHSAPVGQPAANLAAAVREKLAKAASNSA